MRGKLPARPIPLDARRIIPARAGQTGTRPESPRTATDHPRACGANNSHTVSPHWRVGSSPRVRGKRTAAKAAGAAPRIIPARAGQTRSRPLRHSSAPDHPRACGANSPCLTVTPERVGSSPRVRGKHDAVPAIHGHGRIIPARAGQTQPCRIHRRGVADHPRACGANLVEQGQRQIPAGSSPRVRGKRCDERFDGLHHRIIPARAGQTRSGSCRHTPPPDHPRACGANDQPEVGFDLCVGSSPRVRGKPVNAMVL